MLINCKIIYKYLLDIQNVHNQKYVRIKFHFNGAYYSMIAENTPAPGSPVSLSRENNKPIPGYYLPYPYLNNGHQSRPKFWFMRMGEYSKKNIDENYSNILR